MARDFKEKAHLNTDPKKYGEGYDRIFGKKTITVAEGLAVVDSPKVGIEQKYMDCPNCSHRWLATMPGHLEQIGCALCGTMVKVNT